jgi:hypothetical protein
MLLTKTVGRGSCFETWQNPKTTGFLRTFVELFVTGKIPKPLWKFLSTAIMTPFHKLAQMERGLL